MSSRWILLALCSLGTVVVAAAICFVRSRSEPLAGVDETIGTIPRSLADAECGLESHASSSGTGRTAREDMSTGDESARSPLRIVVLERGTRRRVPKADVAVWADPTGDHETVRYYGRWIGPDFSAFVTSHGTTLATNELGEVDLERDGHGLYVAARSDELFGLREISPDTAGPIELEIAPSHSVDVFVRDASGRPCAGIGVGVSACRDGDAFWADVTDASGHCRIHDFEAVVEEGIVKPGDAVAVRLDVAASPAVEQWIDPARVPSEPIVLIVPPTGTVRVRLVDGAGRLLAVDGEVQIGVNDDGLPGSVRPFVSSSSMRVPLRAGQAVADHVLLNRQLWISADLDGEQDPSCDVAGPKLAGETVDVALAVDADCVLVRGRAFDVQGAPLCEAALEWANLFDDGRKVVGHADGGLRTNAEGRFVWTMKRAADDGAPNLRRTCRLVEGEHGTAHRESVLTIPLVIAGDVLDLGDVQLHAVEALVRGRVVDGTGRGVRDVTLESVILVPKTASRGATESFDPCLDAVENDPFSSRIWTAADGSFALYGPCLDLRRAVRVPERGGEETRIVPFTCGSASKPLEIVVRAVGHVSGTALVDRDWKRGDFRVRFVADSVDEAESRWANWWVVGDHVFFRIEGTVAARGRVEFYGEDPPLRPALVVSDIDMLPGSDASPRALVDVDLRGKLPHGAEESADVIELEVVDVGGRPIPSGIAWVWTDESTPDKVGWAEGRARISREKARSVEVWAPGRCFSVVRDLSKNTRVVLRPEIELEIELTLPAELRDPAITHTSMLRYMAAEDDPMSPRSFDGDSAIELDGAGKTHLRVAASGWHGVEVSLTRRVGPETEDDDGTLHADILQWFRVSDAGGVQTLTFAPDAEQRETASNELGLTKD